MRPWPRRTTMADLKKVAELAKNATTKLVFSTTEYQGSAYVDIREFVTSSTYTGFTKKGIRFHSSKLDDFIGHLKQVQASLPAGAAKGTADGPEPEEA